MGPKKELNSMAENDLDDLDELLAPEATEPEAAAEPVEKPKPVAKKAAAPKAVVPDPEPEDDDDDEDAVTLRALQAELAAPVVKKKNSSMYDDEGRPLPEKELTETQRAIRAAQDELARRKSNDLDIEEEHARPGKQTILIHMLVDGLVINGTQTYRGQEFEFEVGGKAYEQTKDRNGDTWLDLADDIDGQYDKWGEQKFALGPWRGHRQVTEKMIPRGITDPEERRMWLAEAQANATAEQRRGRAAPVLTGVN